MLLEAGLLSRSLALHLTITEEFSSSRGEYDDTDKYSTQTPKKSTFFSGQYLRNCSTLDIGVLGYIGIV